MKKIVAVLVVLVVAAVAAFTLYRDQPRISYRADRLTLNALA